MEWTQTLAIIGSLVGAVYAFYYIMDKRMDRMDDHHREDMKLMDAKWERLFERLLIQDQQKNK